MKRYIKNILFLILCLGLQYRVNGQTIKVDAALDSSTMKIGDQTKLHLSIHLPAKQSAVFPILADSIGKVQIIAVKNDTSADKTDNSETITRSYTLTAFDAGTYHIPPYTIHTKNGDFITDSLILRVNTVKVDTTKAIYDIKQPLSVTYTFFDWLRDNWGWVALGIGILLLIAGVIYYFKTKPKNAPVPQVVKVTTPPHIIALGKLTELKSKNLWQNGQFKEYHSELTDVLREYLESRYNIKAHEQTTDEIMNSLRYAGIPADNREKLHQMLVLADLVKFAKEKPIAADNENSMENAISFVTETRKPEPQRGNREGEQG